jgi:hypothetical protein
MAEEEPFERVGELEPTRVELKGPNVTSTLDSPPRQDAIRMQLAAIRRHLQRRRRGEHPPEDPAA